jgi:hypothetical protein
VRPARRRRFIYCILTPRYLRLTGSIPATVIDTPVMAEVFGIR